MAKTHQYPDKIVYLLPDPIGGAHDVGLSDELSVVVPQYGENLIRNPLNVPYGDLPLMAFSTIGNLPTWVTGASPFSPYAHQWDPAAGQTGFQMVDTGSPVPMGPYVACFAIKAECGVKWQVEGSQNTIAETDLLGTFESNGCWQRICFCGQSKTDDPDGFVDIVLNPINGYAPTTPWYTSNYQLSRGDCEKQTFVSGYGFDWPGAQSFPGKNGSIYQWLVGAHSSPSTRHRLSRSGGEVRSFSDIGFVITGATGLRMAPVRNIFQPYAKIDGSIAEGQFYGESTVSLTMRYIGSRKEAAESVACLEEMFKRFSSKCPEPIQLLYQCRDDCGNPCGEELKLIAWYESGLEGTINDACQEEFTVNLRTNQPFWQGDRVTVEGPLLANGGNTTPNAVGPATLQAAYCVGYGKKTAVATYPIIVIQGANASLIRILNCDTGSLISTPTGLTVVSNEVLVINTDPTNSSILVYGPNNSIRNASGVLAGPGLSTFCLEPGYNNIEFTFSSITNPPFVGNDPPTGVVPPTLTFGYSTNYISFSEACICNDWGNCDTREIQTGFVDLGGPTDNSIMPPNNAPV